MEDSITTDYSCFSLRKPESICDLGRDAVSLHHVFGSDIGRRGNLHLIDDDKIIYASSSSVVIESIATGVKNYLLSIDDNGIGCVAVHPAR
jgi:hypothetical protein